MVFKQFLSLIFIACFAHAAAADTRAAEDVLSKNSTALEVVFETSMGVFNLALFPDKAPIHVENFLAYVDEGFYDNTVFHRVIADFVIQGGGFEKGMKHKKTRAPIKNESSNRLKNLEGTISMARRTHPDTATSQFYINLKHNASLDYKSDVQPGYTVFGRISKGTDVIGKIAAVPTATAGRFKDVPKEDVVLISVKRKALPVTAKNERKSYVAGEHYIVLDEPIATRDSSKVEVIELFSYGCPHCFEFEPMVKSWSNRQGADIDFWAFPVIWNAPMKLYASAFYTAEQLKVTKKNSSALVYSVSDRAKKYTK